MQTVINKVNKDLCVRQMCSNRTNLEHAILTLCGFSLKSALAASSSCVARFGQHANVRVTRAQQI